MRCPLVLASLAFAFTLTQASAGSVSTDPKQAPSGSYQIDGRHTQVNFAISHFGLTDFYGRFGRIYGTLAYNGSDPVKSAVNVTIETGSIDTPSSTLNSELQGADVFDTARFGTATFKSTSVVRTGPNTGRITGDLTLKGVTKPVILDVVFNGGLKSPMGTTAYLMGFHATTTIKRSDFNMTGASWSSLVGDDVKLIIEALFTQTKD